MFHRAARATEIVVTLEAGGRAAILAQIEAMSHQALIGSTWTPEDDADPDRDSVLAFAAALVTAHGGSREGDGADRTFEDTTGLWGNSHAFVPG